MENVCFLIAVWKDTESISVYIKSTNGIGLFVNCLPYTRVKKGVVSMTFNKIKLNGKRATVLCLIRVQALSE
jgi:hypothetical protein